LEDEMCNEIKTGIHSPDRLDALVWAITELLLTKGPAEPRVRMV
jgi:phage terminase large subunit-like protein